MGLVKFETGARYDFLTRKVVRLTSTQPREIERFQNIYHNIALLSRGTVMLNKKWQLLGELAYKQRPPEINELYSFGLHQGVSGIEEGSINLRQEKGLKGSIHVRGLIRDRLHIDVNGYVHQFNNYIYLQPAQEFRLTIRGAFPVFTYQQCAHCIYEVPAALQTVSSCFNQMRCITDQENDPLVENGPVSDLLFWKSLVLHLKETPVGASTIAHTCPDLETHHLQLGHHLAEHLLQLHCI